MNITEVRLTKLENSKALALASITIDKDFVVTGLTVYEGQNGLWVSMPSKKNKEGSEKPYSDVAYPITKEARQEIQDAVLTKYQEVIYTQTPEQKEAQNDIDFSILQEDPNGLHTKKPQVLDVNEDDLPF